MPYICQNCGTEGRYDSEQDVAYDAYTYYACQDSVDSCPDCSSNTNSDGEEHQDTSYFPFRSNGK